ncbi:MAG: Asp-tRNA(Asn)/Glu-tRNA(Gln) amidotransferase subunit GatC [Gemmatimonadaceae bacterium]
MPVTREDLLHVAALARLALDEAAIPTLVKELNGILDHMDVLQRVDTAGVTPAEAVGDAGMPLRVDGGMPYPMAHGREAFAPETRDGFLIVPRLSTHEDAPETVE